MDWFSLTTEVLTKRKQEVTEKKKKKEEEEEEEKEGEGDSSSGNFPKGTFDGCEKIEATLDPLEAAALISILEMASLQLLIVDVAASDFSPETSNIVARKKLMDVIKETAGEIRNSRSFKVLHEKVKEEREARRASKELMKSMLSNRNRMEDLKKNMKEYEYNKQKELNNKQEMIASLKDKIHEEITKNDVKLRYIGQWEAAKQGQNKIRCRRAESRLEEQLRETTNRCHNEIRVHREMCAFLALEEQVLVREAERWKETYENEMKRRTEKIKWLEKKKKEQQILLHELKQLLGDRQEEINNYLEFKEKLEKERERERVLNEKAIKIQAWWRGTMVRRGLGAFRKKKKLPKEKKK